MVISMPTCQSISSSSCWRHWNKLVFTEHHGHNMMKYFLCQGWGFFYGFVMMKTWVQQYLLPFSTHIFFHPQVICKNEQDPDIDVVGVSLSQIWSILLHWGLFGAEPGMQDSQKQGLQLLALAQAKSLTTSRKVETSYKLHLHLLKVSSQLHVLLLREHVEMQYNIVSILMLSVICNLQIMMGVLSFFLSLVVVILHWDMKLCCSGHMWNSVLWQQMQRCWLQSFQSMMKETAKYSTQPPWKQAMI